MISKSKLKDLAILLGWIAGLILIAGLFWALTQPVRSRFLVRAVNRVLEQSGDTRRLTGPSSSRGYGSMLKGSWYEMNDTQVNDSRRVLIFSFIGEGTFFPCAALMNNDGKVEEFLALNNHGERLLGRISPGILKTYARRIEGGRR